MGSYYVITILWIIIGVFVLIDMGYWRAGFIKRTAAFIFSPLLLVLMTIESWIIPEEIFDILEQFEEWEDEKNEDDE